MDFVRVDYIFSYWLFIWFLVIFFSKKRDIASPIFGLLLGFVFDIFLFLYLIISGKAIIASIFIIILSINILLIYLLRNNTIRILRDSTALGLVFVLYNIYLTMQKTSLVEVYNSIAKSIINGENKTPLFYLVSKISDGNK